MKLYQVPASGTMAHAWVQMFDSEYEAFRAYCEIYPHNAVLLVDTYNTLKKWCTKCYSRIQRNACATRYY